MIDSTHQSDEELVASVDRALRAAWSGSYDDLNRLVDANTGNGLDLGEAFDALTQERPSLSVDLAEGTEFGGYRIIRVVGRGGMGVVYEAEQLTPKRRVALKVLRKFRDDASDLKLFRREVRTLARLRHPSIATIHEAGQTSDGRHFFAMEYVLGQTLTEYLDGTHDDGQPRVERRMERDRPAPGLKERLRLFRDVCLAVNHAHQRGVIHRDLKPSNILVDEEGRPKVLDFGLARLTDPDAEMTGLVSLLADRSKLIGTLPYMSPEQILGTTDDVDIRSDVYALGVILYEIVVGRRPHDLRGMRLPAAIHAIGEATPDRPGAVNPSTPADVESIILKAMDRQVEQRYHSAEALADDVDRFLTGRPVAAHAPSWLYRLRRLTLRHKVASALSAALFLSIVIFGVVSSVQNAALVSQRNKAETQAQRTEHINEFLERILSSANPDYTRPNLMLEDILDHASRGLEAELAGEPEIRASLHSTLGMAYLGIKRFEAAEKHLKAALHLRRSFGEAYKADFALSLSQCACVTNHQKRVDEAEVYIQHALAIHKELVAQGDSDVTASMFELAGVLEVQGRLDASEEQYRGAIKLLRESDDAARSLGDALAVYGRMLVDCGRLDDAAPVLDEALGLREELLGPDHYKVAIILVDVVELAWLAGDYDAAEEALTRQLSILKKRVPDGDRVYAFALADLATIKEERGQYREAEALFREGVAMANAVFGEGHAQVALPMNNFANFLTRQGRPTEAEPMHRVVSSHWNLDNAGTQHNTAYSSQNLGVTLFELDKIDEARQNLERGIEIWRTVYGGTNPGMIRGLIALARLHWQEGDLDQAEAVLVEAQGVCLDQLGTEHIDTLRTSIYLGRLTHQTGDASGAEMVQVALAKMRTVRGNRHADVAWALGQYAAILAAEQDYEGSASAFLEAIDIERSLPREMHPNLATCLIGLARVQQAKGEQADIRSLLEEAWEIRRARYPEGNWQTAVAQSLLGCALVESGELEEAELMLARSTKWLHDRWGPDDHRTRTASACLDEARKRSAP